MCHILCYICQNFGVVYSGFMCRPHTNAHMLTWLLSGTIKRPIYVGNSSGINTRRALPGAATVSESALFLQSSRRHRVSTKVHLQPCDIERHFKCTYACLRANWPRMCCRAHLESPPWCFICNDDGALPFQVTCRSYPRSHKHGHG